MVQLLPNFWSSLTVKLSTYIGNFTMKVKHQKSYYLSESPNYACQEGRSGSGQTIQQGSGREGAGEVRCECSWMLNNLIMSQLPSSQQKRQRILNYEIRLIEQCPDSLFNCSTCTHDRYLEWGLTRTLRKTIGDVPHRLRWMGNDRNSPLYAYIYIAITACSTDSSLMVELKSALYALAQKYLAVFEQKLLIEFLCLLEYSHQKHLFFRKYASIERIFLRLFAEVERRAPSPTLQSSEQDNTFSKLTTCITSPRRSMEKEEEKVEHVRIGQQLGKTGKQRWVWLLDIYSRHFPFMRVEQLGDAIVRVSIQIERTNTSQDYYVCVEKECFFVVEVGSRASSRHSSNSQSNQEESRFHPCPQCLKGKSSRDPQSSSKINSSRNEQNEFTPKFISSKKKVSLAGPEFYNDNTTSKKVNVEVLDLADFEEKASAAFDSQSTTLHYKKKIDNLANINATIKSIDLEKTNPHSDFRSRPVPQHFGSKQRQVQTEQAIAPPLFPHHRSKQPLRPHLFTNKYPQMPGKKNGLKEVHKQKINPQQARTVSSNEKRSRETLLSANNLRKFLKPSTPFPSAAPSVRFHSHSPPNHPLTLSPLKPRLPLLHPIKFTYC